MTEYTDTVRREARTPESFASSTLRHARPWLPAVAVALTVAAMLVLGDPRTAGLVRNTLRLAGATMGLSVPLGTLFALLLARTDLPGRRSLAAVLAAMLFTPLYLQAAGWLGGFGVQGWFPALTGGPAILKDWPGAAWIHACAALPWVLLIVGAGLRQIDPELEENARLDGSAMQVLTRVTLPAVLPALGLAALWVAITVAGEMTVTDLLAVRTYAEELYTRTAVGVEPGEGPLGVWPGVLLTGLLAAGGVLLSLGAGPHERSLSQRRGEPFSLGRWRFLTLAMTLALLALLVAAPWANLLYKIGVVVEQAGDERTRGWSLLKVLEMTAQAPVVHRREFGWSLLVGLLAASAALLAAVGLVWPARRGGWRMLPAVAVSALSLAVPGPLVGLAIIALLNRPALPWLLHLYDNSILAPLLALTFRALGPTILVVWHVLRGVPGEVLDAAAIDGAGPLARLCRIALPLCWPALMAAWLLALAVALGDLSASILVLPPGVTTLAVRIFELLHYGVEDQVAAIGLFQAISFVGLLSLAAWLWGRGRTARVEFSAVASGDEGI